MSISCLGASISSNDIIWEYYPTASQNQSPLTVIYNQSMYENGLGTTYSVLNTDVSGSVISVLTILSVTFNDNFITFKCECNRLTVCSSFGNNTPFSTATINVPSIKHLLGTNLL